MKRSRRVILTPPQGEKMRQKRLNALTMCIRLTSSCTMWIRCREREREREERKDAARKCSIGYARSRGSRWRAWEHLSFSLSLSLTICSLALALYQVLDRNCLKRSGAKKCRAWHGSPKSSGVCNLQLRQEEDPEVGPFFGG